LPTDKLFTGQRLDSTGLYYYGARYYDPSIGRFISPDSIIPDPYNPQSLNRYSYCLNNPLKYTDPTGHEIYGDLSNIYSDPGFDRERYEEIVSNNLVLPVTPKQPDTDYSSYHQNFSMLYPGGAGYVDATIYYSWEGNNITIYTTTCTVIQTPENEWGSTAAYITIDGGNEKLIPRLVVNESDRSDPSIGPLQPGFKPSSSTGIGPAQSTFYQQQQTIHTSKESTIQIHFIIGCEVYDPAIDSPSAHLQIIPGGFTVTIWNGQ
jgi:RHS repeat-associated protein